MADQSKQTEAARRDDPPTAPTLADKTRTAGISRSTMDMWRVSLGDQAPPTLDLDPRADNPDRQAGPRYLKEEPIGHGGFGEVLACFDRDLRRRVAMKRVPAEHMTGTRPCRP